MAIAREDIAAGVLAQIQSQFRLRRRIDEKTTASQVPGWDSLAHTILVMQLELRFDVEFPDDRLFKLNNVGELVDLIKELCDARAG